MSVSCPVQDRKILLTDCMENRLSSSLCESCKVGNQIMRKEADLMGELEIDRLTARAMIIEEKLVAHDDLRIITNWVTTFQDVVFITKVAQSINGKLHTIGSVLKNREMLYAERVDLALAILGTVECDTVSEALLTFEEKYRK